jgi:hypothetical protein
VGKRDRLPGRIVKRRDRSAGNGALVESPPIHKRQLLPRTGFGSDSGARRETASQQEEHPKQDQRKTVAHTEGDWRPLAGSATGVRPPQTGFIRLRDFVFPKSLREAFQVDHVAPISFHPPRRAAGISAFRVAFNRPQRIRLNGRNAGGSSWDACRRIIPTSGRDTPRFRD